MTVSGRSTEEQVGLEASVVQKPKSATPHTVGKGYILEQAHRRHRLPWLLFVGLPPAGSSLLQGISL